MRTYGDLDTGALGGLVNSHGVIEIALREGSAAELSATSGPGEAGHPAAQPRPSPPWAAAASFSSFAQLSRSVTVRLNTGAPGC